MGITQQTVDKMKTHEDAKPPTRRAQYVALTLTTARQGPCPSLIERWDNEDKDNPRLKLKMKTLEDRTKQQKEWIENCFQDLTKPYTALSNLLSLDEPQEASNPL